MWFLAPPQVELWFKNVLSTLQFVEHVLKIQVMSFFANLKLHNPSAHQPHQSLLHWPLSCFLSVVVPLLRPQPLQILFSCRSADWLAHLSKDKVPEWEDRRKHTCTLIRALVNTCNHMQTKAGAPGCRHFWHTSQHTDKYMHGDVTYTQRTHFQSPSASCFPTLHLINPYLSLTKQERALSSLWTLEQVA